MTTTQQWQQIGAEFNMAAGETIEQLGTDTYLKQIDGAFQIVDYKNSRVSPMFDWGKDASDWFSDNS